MELPSPDTRIVGGKQRIAKLLRKAVPHAAIIDNERETLAYECDALTARRCPPLGGRPSFNYGGGVGDSRVVPPGEDSSGSPRCRNLAFGRCPAD